MDYKKLVAAVIVFMAAIFVLYSQTSAAGNNTSAVSVAEESIILSDDTASVPVSSTEQYKGPSTVMMFVRMILVLIIVVALIYGTLWFIKKKTNVVKTDDEYLRRAAYINIAPGKTVEVITLIDKAYLIGVTEDNITLLGEIHDDELIKAMNITADKKNNTKKPTTFSDVLEMFLIKKGGQKNVFNDIENQISNNNGIFDNGEE